MRRVTCLTVNKLKKVRHHVCLTGHPNVFVFNNFLLGCKFVTCSAVSLVAEQTVNRPRCESGSLCCRYHIYPGYPLAFAMSPLANQTKNWRNGICVFSPMGHSMSNQQIFGHFPRTPSDSFEIWHTCRNCLESNICQIFFI